MANPRDETVEGVGDGGDEEQRERPSEMSIDHEDDQRRHEADTEERQLICEGHVAEPA